MGNFLTSFSLGVLALWFAAEPWLKGLQRRFPPGRYLRLHSGWLTGVKVAGTIMKILAAVGFFWGAALLWQQAD